MALEMAQSTRPNVAARGKILLESLKPVDPKYSGMVAPSGQMVTRPGAPQALAAQQNAQGQMVEIEMGDGSKQRVPLSQALPFLQSGQARLVGPAPEIPPRTPDTGIMPPTGPGTPPPLQPPTGPATPPINGVQVPPPPGPTLEGPGVGNGPPPPPGMKPGAPQANAQVLMANLQEEQQLLAQAQQVGDENGVRQHGNNIAAIQDGLRRIGGVAGGPAPAAPGGAPTGGPGLPPSGAVRPTGPVGFTPAPTDVKHFENIRSENEKALQKWSTESTVQEMESAIAKLKQLNKSPMYTGAYEIPMVLENTLGAVGMGKSEKGKNVEQFEKYSGDLVAGLLRQYGSGNGISDADMRSATMRIPNPRMDPESREALINTLEEKVEFVKYANQRVPVLVRQGNYVLAEAKDIAFKEWQEIKAKEDRAKAAQGAAPGVAPTPAVPRSMKNPNSALSQTMDAIMDVASDTYGGAKNLVGFGDRDKTLAAAQEHEARAESEPIYGGAKKIADVVKYAPALFMGPVGGAAYAGAMKAAQPADSATAQVVEGVTGAAEGGVLGKVANLLKVAPITSRISELEQQVARMAPRAKGRADIMREIEALRLQVKELGGTVGDTISNYTTRALSNTIKALTGRF